MTVDDVNVTALSTEMQLVLNNLPGNLIMSVLSSTIPIAEGEGSLINIVFAVAPDAVSGTQSALEFQDAELYDEVGVTLRSYTQNGVVKIPLKGDVSGNGLVQSNDAILVMRHSVDLSTFTEFQRQVADMDEDGRIRTNDAILILRIVAGLPLSAPDKSIMASTGRQISVTLGEAHGMAGERAKITLKVDNVAGLGGGDICLAYNPAVLRAVDVTSDSGILLASSVNEPGMVRIAFVGSNGVSSETVAEIQFDVLADDASPLELKSVELYDLNAFPLRSRGIDRIFTSWAMPAKRNALLQNFPNPFNPETWIPYQLKETSEVAIRIYSASGELVRELDLGCQPAGIYLSRGRAAYWNGKNELGIDVASGVYFYTIQAGNFSETRKLTILK